VKTTTLVIKDQVNVKFDGLEPEVRRKISDSCKYFVPYARHMPAFKLGRWDGKIAFATIGGSTFINMLDRVLPIIMEAGYDVQVDDRRPVHNFTFPAVTEEFLSHKFWPVGHPAAGEPIVLRDYQVEAINRYLDNPQSIQVIATGGGKTLTTAALSTLIEPHGRSVVIVPSKTLVAQTEEDYVNLGMDVGSFFGDRKEWGHKHTICTWQSLSVFSKKTKAGTTVVDASINDFLKDVVCVMVDECHTLKGTEIKELLCGPFANIPIRWGMTGTIPKEEFESMNLTVSIGPVVGETRAKELQDKGVLANCHISILQTDDSHVEYATYPDEYEYLVSDPMRLKWISDLAIGLEGNTLILVDRIETGKTLTDSLPNAVFISGKMNIKDRKSEFVDVNTSIDKIIVATFGTMSTGVNVPKIHNLILVEAGKSFVRTIQSAGRLLRLAEGKDFANIYDVCSSLKFSKSHLTKRKSFYREAEYPAVVTKVKYR